MTGAGSGSLAFGKEQSFKGPLETDANSDPQYWEFGRDETLTDLSLDNQAQRLRQQGKVESVETIKTGFEGAVGVEATISTDTYADVLEAFVFNNDAGTGFQRGRAASGRIYAGVDYLDGTIQRELVGCIATGATLVSFNGDGTATFDLTMLYASENTDTAITPSNVTSVSTGTSLPFHAVDVNFDGATVSKLQSAELTIDSIAKFHRGSDPEPVDAVIDEPQTQLSFEAIITTADRLRRALGGPTATEPLDTVEAAQGSVSVTNPDGTPAATFDLADVTPVTESWNNVIGSDDTTESITANSDGGVTVSDL